MTVLPKQKLSFNKKIDFNQNQPLEKNESEVESGQHTEEDYELDESLVEYVSMEEATYLHPIIQEPASSYMPNDQNNAFQGNNTHLFNQKKSQEKDYQEMLIVRQALDFDERAFRDSYIRTESEIILKMRKDIDALYDWLDRLVAELTKSLNTFQETEKTTIEEKLRKIRENSIRADGINRSIQNFLSSIQHAYQHTFASFLDNNTTTSTEED